MNEIQQNRTDPKREKLSPETEKAFLRQIGDACSRLEQEAPYFGGGAGVKISRRFAGSGLGLGLGAFLTSFLPLSLFPMGRSLTQKGRGGNDIDAEAAEMPRWYIALVSCATERD